MVLCTVSTIFLGRSTTTLAIRSSDEEKHILAQLEATFSNQAHPNAEVNKFIQSQLKDLYGISRSTDSIKGQRKYVLDGSFFQNKPVSSILNTCSGSYFFSWIIAINVSGYFSAAAVSADAACPYSDTDPRIQYRAYVMYKIYTDTVRVDIFGYCWKGSMSVPAEDGQGGRGLTALGFADDVAIIAKSALGLNLLLRRCSDFLATRHLRLNPKKCAALLLSPAPKTTTPIVGPETHRLPILSPEDSYRYLGFNSPFKGVCRTTPNWLKHNPGASQGAAAKVSFPV
ncbi:hypothetical protein M514_28077 [Trichuris suis]|uniref:Uncharacterized protein n=1 Tax=Trichuris suis TaxID=68888 RepID=A0A085MR96_9BILA|nr:hypothetical protein M514_28077 [Trichuris suis]